MNFSLTDIIKTSAVILSGFALLSCSHDSFYNPETETPIADGPVLGVTLSVGNTRADNDPMNGGFEPGAGYENYLDIAHDDFRIYFFSADDNKYIATFNPDVIPSTSPDLDSDSEATPLVFKGPIPERVGRQFKLVVLANWGGDDRYPLDRLDAQGNPVLKVGDQSIYTIEDLTTNTFGQYSRLTSPEGETDWLSDNRLIPFYGVKSYDITSQVQDKLDSNGRLQEDIYVDLTKDADALPLLRAMAKIEVILDNPFAEFEDVKLTRVNAKGFCAPYKNSEDWKFEHTDYYKSDGGWDGNYVKGVHLTYGADANKGEGTNDADASQTIVNFKKYPATETGGVVTPEKWVAYVPEYKNIGREDFTTIQVRLKDPTKENSGTDTPSAAAEGDSEAGSTADGDHSDDSMWVKQIYFAKGCTSTANATDGNRFDLERNNIYRFTVSGMNANLQCEVEVIPYKERVLRYEYGFEYDSRGDLIVQYDKKTGVLDDYFVESGLLPEDLLTNHRVPLLNNKGKPIDKNGNEIGYENESEITFLERLFEPDGNYDDDPDVPQDPYHDDEFIKEKDYYVIVKTGSVVFNNLSYEIWLKDSNGCRVMSNYSDDDESDGLDCHARLVIDYSGGNVREYYKDREGDKRLHHYPNHAAIVEAKDSVPYYKTKSYEEGENKDDLIPVKNQKYKLWAWDTNPTLWDVPGGRDNPHLNYCSYIIDSSAPMVATEEILKEGLGIASDQSLPQSYAPLIGKTVVKHRIREVDSDGNRVRKTDAEGNLILDSEGNTIFKDPTYDFEDITK